MQIEIEPNPESEHSLGQKNKEREELRALADMIATFLDFSFCSPRYQHSNWSRSLVGTPFPESAI